MTRVVVHIDSLVLNGLRHEDRHAVAAGLQAELQRLFATPNTPASLVTIGNAARLAVGEVLVKHGARPHSVGARAAQGIARSLKA